jgi:hypothetical protein
MDGSWQFLLGRLLSAMLIAGALVFALRLTPLYAPALPWSGVLASLVVAYGAFAVMRRLVGWTWGMLAALLITLIPLSVQAARDNVLLPHGMVLAAFMGVLVGWRILAARTFRPVRWFFWGVTLSFILALTWALQARQGLAASMFALLGMLGGAALALRLLRRGAATSWANAATGIVMAITASLAGLLAAPLVAGMLATDSAPAADALALLQEAVADSPSNLMPALQHQNSRPIIRWLFGALLLWGVWRSWRHGLILWRSGQLPECWLLLLFAIVNMALPPRGEEPIVLLPLLSSAILIGVFGVGDFFRLIGQSLILRPPHERAE